MVVYQIERLSGRLTSYELHLWNLELGGLNFNFILLSFIQLQLFPPETNFRTNRGGGKSLHQRGKKEKR